MASVDRSFEVLTRAEAELRALIEAALAGGRYGDVATIARLADGLRALRTSESTADYRPVAPSRNGHRARARTLPPERRHGGGVPRFEREGNKLIKIAGSGEAEYEHRASFEVVETLLATIKAKRGVGARFSAPEILPLKHPKTRRDIPSYQSYLVLGWLRREGVLVKHGRDAYAMKATADTSEHIQKLWNALPSRDQ